MLHEVIPVGPLQCNCSIIGDPATREAIVIDPGAAIASILALLARHSLTVKQIVITHAHIDHVGGAMKLKQATGAPILMNSHDSMLLSMLDAQAAWLGMAPPGAVLLDGTLAEGDRVQAGVITGSVIHTPGHTEGSVCLYFEPQGTLIAGDTLFAGSIGRTDLPGGDFEKIMRSLHFKLMALPDQVTVIPGHGPATTIAEERDTNPFITDKRYKPRLQQD